MTTCKNSIDARLKTNYVMQANILEIELSKKEDGDSKKTRFCRNFFEFLKKFQLS